MSTSGEWRERRPDIHLRQHDDGAWSVRIGEGAIPELFATAHDALRVALGQYDYIGAAVPETLTEAAAARRNVRRCRAKKPLPYNGGDCQLWSHCSLREGHEGAHVDEEYGDRWATQPAAGDGA